MFTARTEAEELPVVRGGDNGVGRLTVRARRVDEAGERVKGLRAIWGHVVPSLKREELAGAREAQTGVGERLDYHRIT